jgi:hypothetical protein
MNPRHAIALVVFTGIAVGLVVRSRTTHHRLSSETTSAPIDTARVAARPAMATDSPHPTPEAAALEAVRMTGKLATAGFITRNDSIASIASATFASELSRRSAAQLAELTTAVGGAGLSAAELTCEELPLTFHIIHAEAGRETVEVWSLLVIGAPAHGAPRQAWRTVTIGLVWEREAWRVDRWDVAAGPTPALTPTAPISDIAHMTEVLSWSAVGGGR